METKELTVSEGEWRLFRPCPPDGGYLGKTKTVNETHGMCERARGCWAEIGGSVQSTKDTRQRAAHV